MTPRSDSGTAAVERLGARDFAEGRLVRAGVWAVAFVADWCPFCRAFLAPFSELRGAGPFEIAFGDVTDEESPLWDDFRIEVVPTVLGFRDGRPEYRRDGIHGVGLLDEDLAAIRTEMRRLGRG